jgi:hypothetical protein
MGRAVPLMYSLGRWAMSLTSAPTEDITMTLQRAQMIKAMILAGLSECVFRSKSTGVPI